MKLSNKTLVALGVVVAISLFMVMHFNMRHHNHHTPLTGMFDLIYKL